MKMVRLAGPQRNPPPYIGPLPEEEISGRLAFRKIPSEEWQAAHPPGVPCEPPTDEDMVVQCVVLGSYAYPSKLRPPAMWDRGQFPVVELSVTKYLEWKAAADYDIARQKGKLPPDEPAGDPAEGFRELPGGPEGEVQALPPQESANTPQTEGDEP